MKYCKFPYEERFSAEFTRRLMKLKYTLDKWSVNENTCGAVLVALWHVFSLLYCRDPRIVRMKK